MPLNAATLTALTVRIQPASYLRCTRLEYRATPLGMGFGNTRFACPDDTFELLYIAHDLATAIAETIVRDRFEVTAERELTIADIEPWGVCAVDATRPLRVLDLRKDGCFKLGVSTDIVGAKAHDEARRFSRQLYDGTDLDGIVYHSRLRKKNCIAVYDRAVDDALISSGVVELSPLASLVGALQELEIDLIA